MEQAQRRGSLIVDVPDVTGTFQKGSIEILNFNEPVRINEMIQRVISEYDRTNKPVNLTVGEMIPSFESKLFGGEGGFVNPEVFKEAIRHLVRNDKRDKVKDTVRGLHNQTFKTVETNPLDRIANEFRKTGDFGDYVRGMPEIGTLTLKDIQSVAPDVAKVRRSGFYALEEFSQAFKGKGDISKRDILNADPTRMIQAIDGGFFGGPAQQQILWPTRNTTVAKLLYSDQRKSIIQGITDRYGIKGNRLAEAVGDVIEKIDMPHVGMPSDVLLQQKPIIDMLKNIKRKHHTNVVDAAKELRILFEQLLEEQNMARQRRGQEPIKHLRLYRPHVKEANNLWDKIGEVVKPSEIMEAAEMPDFILPNAPFNARAMARTRMTSPEKLERNIIKLLSNYVDTAAKDIFDTNIVQNNKVHAAVLRKRGLEIGAEAVDRWTAEAFAGVNPRLTKTAKEVMPNWMRSAMLAIRRNLTRAVFPLNWTWNTFIQTSSAGITAARYGLTNAVKGLQPFVDPKFNAEITKNAYSLIIKKRRGGSMAYQDVGDAVAKNRKLDMKPIDKVEDFLNFFTNIFEDRLTRHGIGAAYHHGKQLGLKDRALWEYASEGGSKTQSMYNYADVPGILRAKEVGAIAPFQTFAFEVVNTVRELNVPLLRRVTGKTGIYETIAADSAAGQALMSNRLKILARWTAAIVVTNAMVDEAIGRNPWQPSSFVPFFALLTGGPYMGKGTIHQQYIQEFKNGVKDVVVNDSFRRLRKWFIQYHVPAGIQMERTLQGIEAVARGAQTDVKGRTLFKVEGPVEGAKAILGGPYRTEAGKEYVRQRQKSQSFIRSLTLREGKKKTKRPTIQ
jgi:molybdopterin synthase catalytic subunit